MKSEEVKISGLLEARRNAFSRVPNPAFSFTSPREVDSGMPWHAPTVPDRPRILREVTVCEDAWRTLFSSLMMIRKFVRLSGRTSEDTRGPIFPK